MSKHRYLDTDVRIWDAGDSIRVKIKEREQPMYVPKNSALFKHLREAVEKYGVSKSNNNQ